MNLLAQVDKSSLLSPMFSFFSFYFSSGDFSLVFIAIYREYWGVTDHLFSTLIGINPSLSERSRCNWPSFCGCQLH